MALDCIGQESYSGFCCEILVQYNAGGVAGIHGNKSGVTSVERDFHLSGMVKISHLGILDQRNAYSLLGTADADSTYSFCCLADVPEMLFQRFYLRCVFPMSGNFIQPFLQFFVFAVKEICLCLFIEIESGEVPVYFISGGVEKQRVC